MSTSNTPSDSSSNTPSNTPSNTSSNTSSNTPSDSSSNTPSDSSSNTPSDSSSNAPSPIEAALAQAARGLSYTSETDSPLTPFFWPGAPGPVTAQGVALGARLPAAARIEQQTLEAFFEPVATEEDWMDEEERSMARGFQALAVELPRLLREVAVFRVGESSLDVYVVGITEGGLAGLSTEVVET